MFPFEPVGIHALRRQQKPQELVRQQSRKHLHPHLHFPRTQGDLGHIEIDSALEPGSSQAHTDFHQHQAPTSSSIQREWVLKGGVTESPQGNDKGTS